MNNLTKNYIERKEEFVEKGADLEHQRWANWQRYLHSICYETKGIGGEPTGDLQIPVTSVKHWERQINTNYKDLTEREKESDRKETRNYLPLQKSDILSVLDVIEKWIDKNEYCSKCCSPKKYCREFGKYASALDTKDLLQFVKEAKDEIIKN